MTAPVGRIVLIGPSGSGKSTIGRLLAERLGWTLCDTDEAVAREAGRSIPDIFATEGEPAFHERERGAVAAACVLSDAVIATGGGAAIDPANAALLWRDAFVLALQARPETALARLRNTDEGRPLLAGDDPLRRIREQQEGRAAVYARADWTVRTDGLTPGELAAEIERLARVVAPDLVAGRQSQAADADPSTAFVVRTTLARYPIIVGWDILDTLGARMRAQGLGGSAHVISDTGVAPHYGERVLAALRAGGFEAALCTVPAGESSKTLAQAAALYDWLVERRAERGDTIVALGGGVVGDLAGYVAATYLRGMALVHVPTTLLSMVDASIGGKTAVDHLAGKNLIGAFHQPRLVFSDTSVLRTLPPRELAAGWAEVIKHAMILDADLLALLEERAEAIAALDPELTTAVVRRNAMLKGQVVTEDERESGRRAILNYGHTLAHAIESATGYGTYLHGEAVGIGMIAVAALSRRVGLSAEAERRQNALLRRLELPESAPGVDAERILAATAIDKKVRGKRVRWVLLEDIGRPVLRDDVPEAEVRAVIAQITGTGSHAGGG